MSTIQARELYLNWLAGNHPTLYDKTIKPVLHAALSTRGRQPLGDWIDDLLAEGNSIPSLSIDSGGASGSSIWDNILSSVTSLGSQYVSTAAAQQLINLNSQRAASGLPPVDQNGNVITSANMAAQSGNYLALQRWLASQGSSTVPTWVWVGGGGLILVALLGMRH